MNVLTILLLLTAVLCASAQQSAQCVSVCELDNFFYNQANGYDCLAIDASNVVCYCPGRQRFVLNGRCRPCEASSGQLPVCNNASSAYVTCLPSNDYGTGYVCLCQNNGVPYQSTDYNCSPSGLVTPRPTTTTTTASGGGGISSPCANGGVFSNGACECPSGYNGQFCTEFDPAGLCNGVTCKNNGFCAVPNTNTQYAAVCLCRTGTWGEYCELNGTLGYCSQTSCLNGAACQENVVSSTRYAYCRCPPGYKGIKCETSYFQCTKAGDAYDAEMYEQGKYFYCTVNSNGIYRLEQRSCAKGLRYNPNTHLCGKWSSG